MNAKKNGKYTVARPRHAWGATLRAGLLGMMAVTVLLVGVACTRNNVEDGTVADSNVGSVTSGNTEKVTGMMTEKVTEARTQATSEEGSGMVTVPGTLVPGTMPGTEPTTSAVTEYSTSGMTTTPGTTPGTSAKRNGKG